MKAVILDTDIGGDIDDTWALGVLLNSPELELKAITTVSGDTRYRGAICAKMLRIAGHKPVPIGLGPVKEKKSYFQPQGEWLDKPVPEADLACFTEDAVQLITDTVNASPEPVTLLAIGPFSNLAELVRRSPETAKKIDLILLGGSVYKAYFGKEGHCREYNIIHDLAASRTVFQAQWHSFTISPLDTCGDIYLRGDHYRKLLDSDSTLCHAVLDNYFIWKNARRHLKNDPPCDPAIESSLICDTAVVALAVRPDLAEFRMIPLSVSDNGETLVDEQHGNMIDVAVSWRDREALYAFLTERLTAK